MFKIVNKRVLNPSVVLMDIQAPFIAKKAKSPDSLLYQNRRTRRKSPSYNC